MRIAEVAERYDISADTLRYYERIGLIPPVTRTEGGIRDYQDSDMGWVEFARCFRSAGVGVEALIEYVSLYRQGDATVEARREIIVEQRDRLAERIDQMTLALERLDYKIANYDRIVGIDPSTMADGGRYCGGANGADGTSRDA
jgi:DNA-binding transcriptional MerR regulator